ncbi:MAG: helix-hairpin-helix domain-containing protein [Crocinitomicaceae bacterium]|nr:helix-hairpin-helix domain-containing protein [Crocinitomicaceae bacterium]
MKTKIEWAEWLFFSTRERNGILLLFLILLGLLTYNYIDSKKELTVTDPVFEEHRKKVLAWIDEKKNFQEELFTEDITTVESSDNIVLEKTDTGLFRFNPNNLSDSLWTVLGLSQRQLAGIRKFEKKGGEFNIKKDLKKMYSIPENLYSRLEPWIDLPDSLVRKVFYAQNTEIENSKQTEQEKNAIDKIELNNVDSIALQRLPGIGPYFARKIVEYRDRLGGFLSFEQLLEVRKITPELVEKIRPNITITPLVIRPLNLNSSSEKDFLNHPYLSKMQAGSIIAYRDQHGLFTSPDDLKKLVLIDAVTFARLKPYLAI